MIVDVYETALKQALADSALFHHLTRVTGKAEIVMKCENLDGIRDKEKNRNKGGDGDGAPSKIPDGPKWNEIGPRKSDKNKHNSNFHDGSVVPPPNTNPSQLVISNHKFTNPYVVEKNNSMRMNFLPNSTEKDMYAFFSKDMSIHDNKLQSYLSSIQKKFPWAKIVNKNDFLKTNVSESAKEELKNDPKKYSVHDTQTKVTHNIKPYLVNIGIYISNDYVLSVGLGKTYDLRNLSKESLIAAIRLRPKVYSSTSNYNLDYEFKDEMKRFAGYCIVKIGFYKERNDPVLNKYIQHLLQHLSLYTFLSANVTIDNCLHHLKDIQQAIEQAPLDFTLYEYFVSNESDFATFAGGIVTGPDYEHVIIYDFPFFKQKKESKKRNDILHTPITYLVKNKHQTDDDKFDLLIPMNTNFQNTNQWDVYETIRYNREFSKWTPFDLVYNTPTIHGNYIVKTNSYLDSISIYSYMMNSFQYYSWNVVKSRFDDVIDTFIDESKKHTARALEISKFIEEIRVDMNLRDFDWNNLDPNNPKHVLKHGRLHGGLIPFFFDSITLSEIKKSIVLEKVEINKDDPTLPFKTRGNSLVINKDYPNDSQTFSLLLDKNFIVAILDNNKTN